jgi:hypothetical protein
MDKTKKIIWYHAHQPLGSFSHIAASRSSSNFTRKMNLMQGK